MRIAILAAIAFALSALLTGLVRARALRSNALDIPNARSSHVLPTARGGGIAIVMVSLAGFIVLALLGAMETRLCCALLGGGAAVALVGHLDDRGRIRVVGRFAVHVAAAIWAVTWLGGMTELHWGESVVRLGFIGPVLAVLAIVWTLNLFNFMDGIDGIAASEAVFVAVAGGVLTMLSGAGGSVPDAAYLLAAASLGFLVWNWPPARIFMGDVGSGYLGFVLAVLALAATRERPSLLAVWLILGGVFFVDATCTLVRRVARREPFYEAHRTHAYQWQSRRWKSHLRVTAACWGLNLLWLAPWAALTLRHPAHAPWYVFAALAPLVVLAYALGSGRREG